MFLKQRKQGCAASGGAGAATSEAGLGVEEGGWARRRDAAEEDQCRGWLAGAPSSKENGMTAAVDAVVLLAEEAGRRRADQPELELKLSSAMATAWHGEAYLGGGEAGEEGNGKRRSRARHRTC